MQTKIVTIRNKFHGSEITLSAKPMPNGTYMLSQGQIKRSKRLLCGIAGCTCSGEIGQRGPNPRITFNQDGTATIEEA